MDLDVVLLHKPSLDKERGDVLPLVALKLNNLSKFRVLNDSSVATKLFLEILKYLGVAVLFLQPLDSCQAFPTITLLHTDVDVLLCSRT